MSEKQLRVTPRNVGELGMWAEGITGLGGWLGELKNPGDGVVYSSNRSWKSWRGERAGHMCASYLLGVISAHPNGVKVLADPDHWVAQMQRAVQVNEVERGQGRKDCEAAIEAAKRQGGRDARAVGA
jgi:hypothetical protein